MSLINSGNGIIGIDYGEMNRVKINLKRARDKSTELNRRINSAITKLQVDKNSSRIKMATDQLRDYSRQVTRMQGDMDRTINKVDKAIRRFKEVDSACAARIRAIGGDESEKKSFLEDAEEGIISLGNKIEGKLEGLLEEGTKIFKEVTGFASEWMDKHPLAVDVIEAVGDVAAIVVTVAVITASAPVVAVVGAAIGVVFAANSLLDEGTKIYNNLRSGSNEGFNAIETGFKDVLGNSAGEVAYEVTNIAGVAVSLPSALRSGVEIISGVKNIIQEGSLLEEGEKLFSSIKESSGEIGNSLNTVKQLITGEKSITIGVLDTGTGLRIPNMSVIDNDIEKISKIENVNVSGLEGLGNAVDYGKLSEDLGRKIEADGYKVINTETPEQANKDWADMGFDLPPVAEKTTVYNVEAGDFSYSRVYLEGSNRPMSNFILRTEDIEGLSAEEIAQKYALPKVPNKIVTLELPSDTPLEVSITGPQESWGTLGGDVQYAIKDVDLK